MNVVRLDVGGRSSRRDKRSRKSNRFKRRVMRTQGGAAPSPVGLVGPATEEAIDAAWPHRLSPVARWPLVLARTRRAVILQSDTAATGLCLLAFQGAGYTHQQHQYASTVARGLQALVAMQKTRWQSVSLGESSKRSKRGVLFARNCQPGIV